MASSAIVSARSIAICGSVEVAVISRIRVSLGLFSEKYFGLVPLTTIPDSDQVIDLDEEQHRRRGRKRGRTK